MKAGKLARIHLIIRRIGIGQMAHHQGEVDGGKIIGLDCPQLPFRKAQAVDARVEMDGGGLSGRGGTAEAGPFGQLLRLGQGGRQSGICVKRRRSGQQAVQHNDFCIRQRGAQFHAFTGQGHEKTAASSSPKRACNRHKPKPIGIRFHRGSRFARPRRITKAQVIAL